VSEHESTDPSRTAGPAEAIAFPKPAKPKNVPFPVPSAGPAAPAQSPVVSFDRKELREILNLYGRKVAEGEWRDYAIDFTAQRAVFSIFRRTSEVPLYRVEKDPKLARRQGAYSVVTATGLILKRGHELARVLAVLDTRVRLVVG
jgi:hypothetical protein